MSNSIFQRVELKYRLSEKQYLMLRDRLNNYITEDEYGLSHIYSLYFDTYNYDVVRNSIEKPVFKEKLRLRSYTIPACDDDVYLELKKKYKGVVYKRRIKLKYQEAVNYLTKGVQPNVKSQILREIDYYLSQFPAENSTLIRCDRIACFGNDDHGLRITFDTNIEGIFNTFSFAPSGDSVVVLPKGEWLMEIKMLDAMPLWLVKTMSEIGIHPSSFSKYGTACMIQMNGN